MKITLITVGKTTFDFVKEGMAMYEKRIGRYLSYTRVEIPALNGTASLSPEEIKEKEGALILKKLKEGDKVILLDEKGRRFSHQIIRLFFTEQLYRAITILRGEPYHNE